MLAIRLVRGGRRNQAAFKIVVTKSTNPPTGGRFVEELGFVNPLTKEKRVNGERAQYWISRGAKPSARIHNLLVSEGVVSAAKIPVHQEKPVSADSQPAQEKPKEQEAPKEETPKPDEADAAPSAEKAPLQEEEVERKKEE